MATYEITAELDLKKVIAESREVAQALNEFADNLEQIEKKYAEKPEEESEEDEEVWCTECPYFKDVTDTPGEWFGALCTKDGHEAGPSMYAIQSLHNYCPLKKESEV